MLFLQATVAHPPFLSGPGNVRAQLRTRDWGACPLGAPATWPAPLRTVVQLMLDSRAAMFLAWGPRRSMLYNDACLAMLGSRAGQAPGRPLEEVWPDAWPQIAPMVERTYAGESFEFDSVRFELLRDGAPREAWFRFSYSPVRCDDGSVGGLFCTLTDTTSQVTAEARLRASEAKFRTMTNAAPQLVWSTDAEGRGDYFNERMHEFTGLSYDELKARSWALIHPDDIPAAQAAFGHARATGTVMQVEHRLRHHSGEYRWMAVSAAPVRDDAGAIVRWMGTCTDIHAHKLLEAALKQARLRQDAAVTAADIGTWTWDMHNDRVHADRNLAQLFGLPPEEADGLPVARYLERMHPDDAPRVGEEIRHAIDTGCAFDSTYRVRRPDGSYRDVQARGKVQCDEQGRPAWFPGIVLDVTAQKAAREALVKSEAQFRRLVECNLIGVVQYEYGGRLAMANDAFLDMLGWSRAEFERDGLSWRDITPPEWEAHDMAAWRQLQTVGAATPFEKEYWRKDGSRAAVYVGAANFEGSATDGIAYILDLSAYKAAERQRLESEARFRTLADNIAQLAWMAEPDGTIFWFNNRWQDYTGLAPGIMQRWDWQSVHHPDHKERVVAGYLAAIGAGVTWEDTFPLRGRDGQYRWFLTRAVPIRDAQGKVTRWFGTNTDVTAQREAEEALRRMDRSKDEFLAMLAHELRPPGAPTAAAADLLNFARDAPDRVQQISNVIARQSAHMSNLIDDLLDVSRVTRGLITLDMAVHNCSAILAEAIEQTRPQMELRGHRLEWMAADERLAVYGDRKRLVQVFANLLNNAAKYTPNGGRILVTLGRAGRQVQVRVRDNGQGMEPELLARAFDLFTQGQRSPDRSQGGLGVGLALVRSLVQLHDGSVAAVSGGAGQGSEFTVLLPLHQAAGGGPAAAGPQAMVTGGGAGRRVLVVDDNQDAAAMLALLLQAVGFDVRIEHDAHAALAMARGWAPEVCVLDIGLPGMDGRELARRLRALPGLEQALLVAVSGYGQAQDRVDNERAGFDNQFVKPVGAAELIAWIEETLPASA